MKCLALLDMIQNNKMENPKSTSRLAVVQALYSINIDTIDAFENKEQILAHTISEIKADGTKLKENLAKNIFNFAIAEEESIKFIIKKYLDKHRTIEDMNPLLYSILRAAISEMMIDKETPRAVLISEYVKIAEEFFTKTEAGFINAILDKYTKDIQAI